VSWFSPRIGKNKPKIRGSGVDMMHRDGGSKHAQSSGNTLPPSPSPSPSPMDAARAASRWIESPVPLHPMTPPSGDDSGEGRGSALTGHHRGGALDGHTLGLSSPYSPPLRPMRSLSSVTPSGLDLKRSTSAGRSVVIHRAASSPADERATQGRLPVTAISRSYTGSEEIEPPANAEAGLSSEHTKEWQDPTDPDAHDSSPEVLPPSLMLGAPASPPSHAEPASGERVDTRGAYLDEPSIDKHVDAVVSNGREESIIGEFVHGVSEVRPIPVHEGK